MAALPPCQTDSLLMEALCWGQHGQQIVDCLQIVEGVMPCDGHHQILAKLRWDKIGTKHLTFGATLRNMSTESIPNAA